MAIIPLDRVLHESVESAIGALRAVGAEPEPRFQLETDVPGLGRIKRIYGIFGNVIDLEGRVAEPVIVERLLPLVKDFDNKKLLEDLTAGKRSFTPVNKRAMRRLSEDLPEVGVHLPWTWKPMNFDFAHAASKAHSQSPLPFIVFYSEQMTFTDEGFTTSRLFSLPIEGSTGGTWAEPIFDELLDPDVGLIVEANVRL